MGPALSLRVLLPALLLAIAAPAQAGFATAGSIISAQDAIDTASSSMPPGGQVTSVRCTTMVRDLSARYRCTVQWSSPDAGAGR